MKLEPECPHCGKNLGRRSLPDLEIRGGRLADALVKMFGKDATRRDVSVCQACEKPARVRSSKCVWCWEEFSYYTADWKARRRRWCSACVHQRAAWNVTRHRLIAEFRKNPEHEGATVAELMKMIRELPLDEQEKMLLAFEDGTIDLVFGVPDRKRPEGGRDRTRVASPSRSAKGPDKLES